MLVAIKLLLAIAILCYGISIVLADQGRSGGCSLTSAFQAPLTQFLTNKYGGASTTTPTTTNSGQGEDSLRPKTCRTESTLYSKKQVQTLRHRPSIFEAHFESKVITTVDGLRVKHGHGSFWGDLNHVETRFVYHQLLPKQLLQDVNEHKNMAVEDLARLASMARHAARLYARERSSLPLRLIAGLYDGYRHFRSFGRWSWTGMTYEEVWAKYEAQILHELGERADEADRAEVNRLVALRILQKSCQTHPGFDRLANMERAEQLLAKAARRGIKKERARIESMPILSLSSSSSSSSAAAVKRSPLMPLIQHFEKLAKKTEGL